VSPLVFWRSSYFSQFSVVSISAKILDLIWDLLWKDFRFGETMRYEIWPCDSIFLSRRSEIWEKGWDLRFAPLTCDGHLRSRLSSSHHQQKNKFMHIPLSWQPASRTVWRTPFAGNNCLFRVTLRCQPLYSCCIIIGHSYVFCFFMLLIIIKQRAINHML